VLRKDEFSSPLQKGLLESNGENYSQLTPAN
jgi:hypothetical protein